MKHRAWTIGSFLLGAVLLNGLAIAQPAAILIINVKTGSEPANARIRVIGASGESVGEGRSGQSIRVAPGIYTVAVQNLDLIDKPERRRRDVALTGGQTVRHTSEWPVAKVKLMTRVGGRNVRTKVVLYHAGGGDSIAEFASGQFVRASPGHYEAKVHRGSNVTTVTGLQFIEGAEQQIPVTVQ